MKTLPILFLFLLSSYFTQAQARFVSPIAGVYGNDFIVVNYVDWDTSISFRDNHCRSKTYNGHQGTDFVVRSFRVQDSGLSVRAVDNGRVIFVQDGLFDREKTSVISKKLGNYVGITHAGKLQTYYAHLRKGSITVKKGDSVIAGQKLGLVGSSGNSESPHLHFELWYDSTYFIDPFSGRCGNPSSYWISEPAFDTSYSIWTSGMSNYLCSLDTLKEEPVRHDTFYTKDAAITYWNLQKGVLKDDSLRVDWYNPSGVLWWSYGYKSDRDYWYAFFSSYINTPTAANEGKWNIKYYRNNVLAATRPFYFFDKPLAIASLEDPKINDWKVSYNADNIIITGVQPNSVLKLINISSQTVRTINVNQPIIELSKEGLPKGIYLLQNISADYPKSYKKVLVL